MELERTRNNKGASAWARLPLREFQSSQPPISYEERYEIRYGTKLPVVDASLRSEEHRYLFWAGHEHDEVGLRSILFLTLYRCLVGAIRQDDGVLFQDYWKIARRAGGTDNDALFVLAAQRGNVEIAELMLEHYRPPRHLLHGVVIPNKRMLRMLLGTPMAEDLHFRAASGFLPELSSLMAANPPAIQASIPLICGLLTSGEKEKEALGRELLQSTQFTSFRSGSILAWGCADDPDLFASYWDKWESKLLVRLGHLLHQLAWVGAVKVLAWVWGRFKVHLHDAPFDSVQFDYHRWRCLLREDKIGQVIAFLAPTSTFEKSKLCAYLYAHIGDPGVLDVDPKISQELHLREVLFDRGHQALFVKYCEKMPAPLMDWRPGMSRFCIAHKLLPWEVVRTEFDDLSLQDWNNMAQLAAETPHCYFPWDLMTYIPTPALFAHFVQLRIQECAEERSYSLPPFATFACVNEDTVRLQIDIGNVEFVRFVLSQPWARRFSQYKDVPPTPAMKRLLSDYGVAYEAKKARRDN